MPFFNAIDETVGTAVSGVASAVASATARAEGPTFGGGSGVLRIEPDQVDAAIAAWTGAVEELRSIVEQLRAARQTNVSTDEAAAQPFGSAPATAG